MKRFLPILGLLALVGVIAYRSLPNEKPELSGTAMGTTWHLKWRGDAPDREALRAQVSETLEKWEQVLSQWRDDSDLTNFNHGRPATPELQRVIELAEEVHKASAGAFDYRMLRESNQAGFGPSGNGIDLSAIGKGFAVDRVGDSLRELGVTDFVFELGGEVIAGDGEWIVGIETPDPASQSTSRTTKLKNMALATSGNYRQFHPAPGGLASHILDPRTRKPIVRLPSSVSVIAKDCATADAWATALFVLGKEISVPPSLKVYWNDGELRQ